MTIKLTDDELVRDAELAKMWGCTTRTLRRYQNEINGLPYVNVGGAKYRPLNGCKEWLNRRICRPNPSRPA